jgi:hypothetical protein
MAACHQVLLTAVALLVSVPQPTRFVGPPSAVRAPSAVSAAIPHCFGVSHYDIGYQLECANPCAEGCEKITIQLLDGAYQKCSCGSVDVCCDIIVNSEEGPRLNGYCGQAPPPDPTCPGAGQCAVEYSNGEYSSLCRIITPP